MIPSLDPKVRAWARAPREEIMAFRAEALHGPQRLSKLPVGELKRYAEALPAHERATALEPASAYAWSN
jgi:hypothetical protein